MVGVSTMGWPNDEWSRRKREDRRLVEWKLRGCNVDGYRLNLYSVYFSKNGKDRVVCQAK